MKKYNVREACYWLDLYAKDMKKFAKKYARREESRLAQLPEDLDFNEMMIDLDREITKWRGAIMNALQQTKKK